MAPSEDEKARKATMKAVWRELHARQPGFLHAISEDARVTALQRGERHVFRSKLDKYLQIVRLMWMSDAFLAHVLYRLRMRLVSKRVPILPVLLHRASMAIAQVSIGLPVLMHPGVYIVHGQVVLDGLVEIGPECVIAPWTSIGLQAGNIHGPKIGTGVAVGTGAKLLGDVKVGDYAIVGANAVVVKDVPRGAIVVGIPAKQVGESPAVAFYAAQSDG